jgi:hypothetical protein
MNRTTAIILTLTAILLCGCPGLISCAVSVYALTITPQALTELMQANGVDLTSVGGADVGIWIGRLVWGVIALVLIAIPVVVGLVTLRRKKTPTY